MKTLKSQLSLFFQKIYYLAITHQKKISNDDIIDEFFSDEEWSISHLIENEISKFRFHSDYDRIEIKIDGLLNNFNEKLEKNISSIENQK